MIPILRVSVKEYIRLIPANLLLPAIVRERTVRFGHFVQILTLLDRRADAIGGMMGKNLDADHLMPTMDDWDVFPREAVAVGMKAQEQGLARVKMSSNELYTRAQKLIKRSRNITTTLMKEGLIGKFK